VPYPSPARSANPARSGPGAFSREEDPVADVLILFAAALLVCFPGSNSGLAISSR